MSIYETISVKCYECGKLFNVTAARHRRAVRRGVPVAYFCGIACSKRYVAKAGKLDQERSMKQKEQE